MKGIILAGGSGSRLYPMTKSVSKQILPVYDKPMIYYPLSCLMLAGIRDIIIISTPRDIGVFEDLFGNGEQIGLHIEYAVQNEPRGIAQSFILAEEFIKGSPCALVLGDNVFYGTGLGQLFLDAKIRVEGDPNCGSIIFAYYVENPSDFGVVEFNNEHKVINIEEKPQKPKSHFAIPGFYFYDSEVSFIAKNIKPSARGELEITTVNQIYLERSKLHVEIMGRGVAWLDTGTCEGLMQASSFVEAVQKRQGMYIACIEEIAWRMGFIDTPQLEKLGYNLKNTDYGKYLMKIVKGDFLY